MRLACQNLLPTFFFPLLLLAGCGRKAAPATESRNIEPPAPAPIVEPAGQAPRLPPAAAGGAPAVQPAETAPRELAQRLRAAGEPDERAELVRELWSLATPEAVEILRQQFHAERDADVKADIVAGLVETTSPETREVRFGIFAAALAPAQPDIVRIAAIAVVTEFDDPRAVALLQNLLQDADEEIRDAAKEALEARREKESR